MAGSGEMAGSARLVLVDGAVLLHPEPAVFEAILAGWRLQQESRLLAALTVDSRDKTLRRFQVFTGDYPWRWGPGDIEEWSVSLRTAGRSRTTIRAYQNAVAMFCDFACDGRYGWALECEERFGEHPSQICHDWNTADHVADYEATRPGVRSPAPSCRGSSISPTIGSRRRGRMAARAGWRRGGTRRCSRSPMRGGCVAGRRRCWTRPISRSTRRRRSWAGSGCCRCGGARRCGAARPAAAMWPRSCRGREVLQEYLTEVRPLYGAGAATTALWLTERGSRISVRHINERFVAYRDAMGLAAELTPHCLRHSYVSHLVEDGVDPLFVQQQVGHSWASTTALYTSVTNDYKNTMMRKALARAFDQEDE